jgi:hypothetical protein
VLRRFGLIGALIVTALVLALAGPSHGASRAPHLNISTPGECEAGIELDGAPRFFCDLISFTEPAGWGLVPSNTMLVAAPSRPDAGSSFSVTTGKREFSSFAAFAAFETPIARRLVDPGSTTVFVEELTLPAGPALSVTVHLPSGPVHEIVGVLYKKTPYLISTVATTDADQLALQQLIASADFEHPAGISKHLLVSMDWTARLAAAGGAGPVSVTAANVEIGNRRWSTRLTVSNLGHTAVSLSNIALLRYEGGHYANPLGFTSTSAAKPLVRRLGPRKTWTGTADGPDNIAFPDSLFRLGVSVASISAGGKPLMSQSFGPVLAAPAAT